MAKQPIDTAAPGAEPTAAEVRAALERILRSQCFEHAGRASDFLRFVVAETLAGEAERLKGYTIAISVFGRPPDFDAQADPLVRVEALRLRQRLTEYYSGEGAADRVRIELPRGGYAVKASLCRAANPSPPQRSRARRRRTSAQPGSARVPCGSPQRSRSSSRPEYSRCNGVSRSRSRPRRTSRPTARTARRSPSCRSRT